MKKITAKTGKKAQRRKRRGGKSGRKAVNLAAVREQITKLVGSQAVGLVESTMDEVEKGHYLALKYLFELVGLYPATAQEAQADDESMAKTLLRRLNLPESPQTETEVTKDCEAAEGEGAGDTVE